MRGSAFFEDVRQVDIMIGDRPIKSPTFYYDASYISAVFPARYRGLRELMPDPRYVPARFAPGLGVAAIACLEYRDTDVGPYRVVAISIPLNEPYFRANLPGRALMSARRLGQFHAFIRTSAVTSEVVLRANDFYSFPMFTCSSRTSISRRPTSSPGVVWPRARSTSSRSRARGSPRPAAQRIDVFLHLWTDGQPQSA